MNFCRRCGNKLESTDKFCTMCGEKVEKVVNENVNPNETNVELTQPINLETETLEKAPTTEPVNEAVIIKEDNNVTIEKEEVITPSITNETVNNEIKPKKNNNKLYIILSIIVVALIILITVLLLMNGNKKSSSGGNNEFENNDPNTNINTNTNNNTNNNSTIPTDDIIEFKGFTFTKDKSYTYQINQNTLGIYNDNYMTTVGVFKASFDTLKSDLYNLENSYKNGNMGQKGYIVSNLKNSYVNGNEVIVGEITKDGKSGVWYVIKADTNYIFQGYILAKTGIYNESNLNIAIPLVKASRFTGSSSTYTEDLDNTTFDIDFEQKDM